MQWIFIGDAAKFSERYNRRKGGEKEYVLRLACAPLFTSFYYNRDTDEFCVCLASVQPAPAFRQHLRFTRASFFGVLMTVKACVVIFLTTPPIAATKPSPPALSLVLRFLRFTKPRKRQQRERIKLR